MKSFNEVACSTSNGLKTSISATNSEQLRSVGCLYLTDKPTVRVIEKIGDVAKVTITTASSIIPIWVKTYSLDCAPAQPGAAAPQFRSAHQQTGDGFVWKDGHRIGWVDEQSATFYRIDQIVVTGPSKPLVKANAVGVKILTNLDAAILGGDQAAAKPPEAALDRTADGFIWRGGKRIGWVDASTSTYYRVDQMELGEDKSMRPKQGEIGSMIEQGRLLEAVARAEKKG